jgi:ferric-dicitrate binding protein FerR (iron transport regulator)
MVQDLVEDTDRIRAAELLRAGRSALADGQDDRAHDLWRQSATLYPQNEAVWLSLLQVVRSSDDRRVCLENIITINPRNEQAMRQLRALTLFDTDRHNEPAEPPSERKRTAARKKKQRHPLWRLALLIMQILVTLAVLVLLAVLAMAAGVLLSSI